jgi:hypothetical protein
MRAIDPVQAGEVEDGLRPIWRAIRSISSLTTRNMTSPNGQRSFGRPLPSPMKSTRQIERGSRTLPNVPSQARENEQPKKDS